MENWKVKIGLWECKAFYGLTEEEESLPFLPRVEDVVFMSDACEEKLRKRLLCNNNEEIVDSIISRLYEMCRGIIIFGKDKRKELV